MREAESDVRSPRHRWVRPGWAGAGLVALLALLVCGASCGMMLGQGPGVDREAASASGAREEPFRIYISRAGPTGARFDVSGLPVRTDVKIFYEHEVGTYPRIWDGRVEHGGTPVGLDLVAHLRKVREDVVKRIPDPSYDGLAVLDFESRSPTWGGLNEEYRDLVRGKVRASNPMLAGAELEEAAIEAYDTATKRFMRTTIAQARSARPMATWGFYYFPETGTDVESYRWLAEVCDAMFPSAYPVKYSVAGQPRSGDERAVGPYGDEIAAKIRTARAHAGDKPVYLFVRHVYHEMNKTYGGQGINDLDQRAVVLRPQQEGADGIIFWEYTVTEQDRMRSESHMQRLRPLMMEALRRDQEQRAAAASEPEAEPEPG